MSAESAIRLDLARGDVEQLIGLLERARIGAMCAHNGHTPESISLLRLELELRESQLVAELQSPARSMA